MSFHLEGALLLHIGEAVMLAAAAGLAADFLLSRALRKRLDRKLEADYGKKRR